MSDTIKAWHEMQEEKLASLKADEAIVEKLKKENGPMYIFVLDFTDGKAYRYNVAQLCNEKNWSSPGYWKPQTEECEAFLIGAGHSLGNIEWMITDKSTIEYGN